MSFTTVASADIAAGKPTKQELFQTLKDDLDDHESRILTVESALTVGHPFELSVMGKLTSAVVQDGFVHTRAPFSFTLLACRLLVITAGSSGTLSLDVEYKRGAGAWTSILSSNLSAAFGTGDLYTVSGTLAVSSFLAGDLFRLNIDSVQVDMKDFFVFLER